MNAPQDERRRELDRLQDQVATRASILHFAHGVVSTILSLMSFGLAYLFGQDASARGNGPFAWPAAILAAGLLAYAVWRFWLGRRAYVRELALFQQLRSLRRELKLEDPSALLPP